MLYHHLAKFRDHWYCGSRDIMVLICHMTKQGQVIQGSGDYNGRSPSTQVITLPGLVHIGTVVVEIQWL